MSVSSAVPLTTLLRALQGTLNTGDIFKVYQGNSQGNISVDSFKLDSHRTNLSVLKSVFIIHVECALSLALSIHSHHQGIRILSHQRGGTAHPVLAWDDAATTLVHRNLWDSMKLQS